MKTTRFFIGVIALLSVFSCQKEELPNNDSGEMTQGELITCTFDTNESDTKTGLMQMGSLAGTIKWNSGDKIMLFDGISNCQELTLATNGTPSSTTGVIKSSPWQFTFVKPDGWTNVYAIYPYSACVTNFDPSNPKLNFAGQDGTFAKANISAAAEVSGMMTFKNVGSMFEIYYNNYTTLPEIQYVEIPLAELAKDYQVSFSGATPSLTPVDATNSNIVTVTPWSNSQKYFGVPAGSNLKKGSTFIYRSASKSIVGYQIFSKDTTTTVNERYVFPYVKSSDGKLPGVFSVSADKKVRFSKGNLRAKKEYSNWKWGFFDQQYDINPYPTTSGSRTATANDTLIDLFCWGYDATGSVNPIEERTAASFTDWGTAIDNEGTWRTLSQSEWAYLLNEGKSSSKARTQANRFAKAMVNEIKGLIIFPDGYNDTTEVSGVSGISSVNNTSESFPSSTIDSDIWTKMESEGCVFLPASGYRFYSPSVLCVEVEGYYWSSSPFDQEYMSYTLEFGNNGCSTKAGCETAFCGSVRLVTNVN